MEDIKKEPIGIINRLINLGGKEWQKNNYHRVYFNNIENLLSLIDFKVEYYNTGNILSARLQGEKISNSRANELINKIEKAKIFYDVIQYEFNYNKNYSHYFINEIIEKLKEI
jgi:hypothetical protein